ncbi:MAG: 30S ribosome-binding factor RbfA [Acidobacteria bacterium]|nr:30S ribosome-binding factor RbfA [Acidobacteriota bacterium]
MKSYRPARIAELLKEEITQIINYELADKRIRPATVTYLKLSPDLRHARVYVSLLGSREEIEETIRRLNRATGFIRSQLYPRLYLRFVPQLTFHYDDTLEKAERLEKLLAEESETPRE